jgi:hypothetical protein
VTRKSVHKLKLHYSPKEEQIKTLNASTVRRHGHTTLNCKTRARDILNGKLKESTNIVEDSLGAMHEYSSSYDEPPQSALKLFLEYSYWLYMLDICIVNS